MRARARAYSRRMRPSLRLPEAWRYELAELVPLSLYLALGSLLCRGLSLLASGLSLLAGLLFVLFLLGALAAGAVGLLEFVASERRSRILSFLACGYGVLAVLLTLAEALAHGLPGPATPSG